MNVFYLSSNHSQNAAWHVDDHVRKMVLEYTQMLSAAYYQGFGIVWRIPDPTGIKPCWYVVRMSGHPEFRIYAKTHFNHPSSVWTRQSIQHWYWMRDMALALCDEFKHRFGNDHATAKIIQNMVAPPPLPNIDFVPPPQAMPDEFKSNNCIEAYQRYYREGKRHLHNWTNRFPPAWI